MSWECGLVVESLCSLCKALASIPGKGKERGKKERGDNTFLNKNTFH